MLSLCVIEHLSAAGTGSHLHSSSALLGPNYPTSQDMRVSVGQGRWISLELSSVCCCNNLFLQALTDYTALHNKPVLHPAVTQRYLFSFPTCLGLKSQLKTSLFCPCLIAVSLFPSPFAAVSRLSCVRVQFATLDVRGNKVSLCDVLECFAPQPPSPCTTGGYGMFATDLRNSRSHPHAQKSFQKER